jgi:anti-anti-sigma regulatory factor
VVVQGRIAPADVAPLRDRFGVVLAESGDGPVVCDVSGLVEPDAAAIDLFCRLSLLACRSGRAFAIQGPAPELRELLDLCGVAPVLPALAVSPDQASSRGGRPKSGKNFAVSRKNVIPVILPPDSSST